MNRSLEEMIKSYSDELMDYARAHNSESLVMKGPPSEGTTEASEVPEETAEVPMQNAEEVYEEPEQRDEAENMENDILREIPSEEDMESYALFKGRVFTGFGAFPVENAKVILYRNDVLYAFLTTDKSGETPTIKLESFPEGNSLEPLSDEQRTDYSADVYADGFTEKKNLLVSAVGGSEAVLDVELTPEGEVIS